ncbi:S1/P1 nuclease [Trema orientale]|uniref:Aspergillus nuclease S1 n=1 Tax=Trema orientale TaxID=63057 RepID=A0A2P5G0X1_TREOI|nr:S1/P1 nuclease [Trema orientale]
MYGRRLWLIGGELVFMLLIPGILGWGPEGHYATCKIAELKVVLLQFALGLTTFANSYDGALRYTLLIHQIMCVTTTTTPLHMGYLGDYGGNLIKVVWYDNQTNLHRVWDDKIIESALTSFYNSDLTNMIQTIQQYIENSWSNDASSWGICANNQTVCPDPYASESVIAACKFAYPNATAGSTLGDQYFLSRLPVVERKLAQGGVRLAATLNRIFSSHAKLAEA